MPVARPGPELIARVPVTYVVFDLLHLDGASTVDLPYEQRRDLLAGLGLVDAPVVVPPHFVDRDPAAVMVAAHAQGLEGVVIKRLGSGYQPGRRSRDWIKVPSVGGVVPYGKRNRRSARVWTCSVVRYVLQTAPILIPTVRRTSAR
jgi:bifunctional non-homologous end joining protein LigD